MSRMNGMYHEDQDNKARAEYLVAIGKLKDEADVVLEGDADEPHENYQITKPEDGVDGVTVAANPYIFAQDHRDKRVLVLHGDGTFDRYNHSQADMLGTHVVTGE